MTTFRNAPRMPRSTNVRPFEWGGFANRFFNPLPLSIEWEFDSFVPPPEFIDPDFNLTLATLQTPEAPPDLERDPWVYRFIEPTATYTVQIEPVDLPVLQRPEPGFPGNNNPLKLRWIVETSGFQHLALLMEDGDDINNLPFGEYRTWFRWWFTKDTMGLLPSSRPTWWRIFNRVTGDSHVQQSTTSIRAADDPRDTA